MQLRKLEELFSRVQSAKELALFLGAGCSRTGKVPLAGELVEEALQSAKWLRPKKIAEIRRSSYNVAMTDLLDAREHTERIRKIVAGARINLAHLCVAKMMETGVVDTVVTTNFDNLLQRACQLMDFSPTVYDCVVMNDLTTESLLREKDQTIIHLHGQAFGARRLNTVQEIQSVTSVIERVLKQVLPNRMVLVVGYSGDSDQLQSILMSIERERFVYWVPYSQGDASKMRNACKGRERICVTEPLEGLADMNRGADPFFATLLSRLGLQLPLSITDPTELAKHLQAQIAWETLPSAMPTKDAQKPARSTKRAKNPIPAEIQTPEVPQNAWR